MAETKNEYRILVGNPERRRALAHKQEDNISVHWIKKEDMWVTGLIQVMTGTRAVCCEYVNEPSGFIRGMEFLGKFSNSQLLNKDQSCEILGSHVGDYEEYCLADFSEETYMPPYSWFKNKSYKLTMHAAWLTLRP